MIEVSGVSKLYGDKFGVRDLSFRVERGEILGLLGPNGAGKSTTLRMLTGYLTPTTGTIRIAGTDLWEEPEKVRARIGYLPDRPPLYKEMTVRAYVDFTAALRGIPRAQRKARVDKALRALDLTDVAGRLVGNLSRGYQQRVALAQAIVHDPEVLVLDEPTTGLDPVQITEIRELIRELGKERTVVLSSHILPEVQLLCSRVLVMARGRVVAEDAPEALSHRLRSGTQFRVQVQGEIERAAEIARAIPGVTRAAVDGQTLLLDAEEGAEIRPDLFYRLAEAKLPLLQLTPVQMTLEEIFLQLVTREEHDSDDGAKEAQGDAQHVVAHEA